MKTLFFGIFIFLLCGCSKTQVSPVPTFTIDDYVGVWENDKYSGVTYTITKQSDSEAKIVYYHNLDGGSWKTEMFTGRFSPKGQYQVYDELQYDNPLFTSKSYLAIYFGENNKITVKSGNLGGSFLRK